MKTDSGGLRLALIIIYSLCLGIYLEFLSRVPGYSVLGHTYVWRPGRLLVAAFILCPLIIGLWGLSSGLMSAVFKEKYSRVSGRDFWTYLPVVWFGLTPLVLRHYLDRNDLSRRLMLLAVLVASAVLVLKAVLWFRLGREKGRPGQKLLAKFAGLSRGKRLALLFVAALLVYNAGSLLLDTRLPFFSGDEPHYLLIAHSLVHDRDFDLTNNYAKRDYARTVLPGSALNRHVIKRGETGPVYSFHSPGVAFVLTPFYALGDLLGSGMLRFLLRLGISLFGALFGLQLYLFARREWGREGLALGLWFLVSFITPVFFYSIHIYPEIIAAFLSLLVFRWIRHSESWTPLKMLAAGTLLASLVWFHALKYLFLIGPLFIYLLWTLAKRHRLKFRLLWVFIGPAVLGGLYLLFQYSLYGSLSPSSVSWRGAMSGTESISYLKYLVTGIPFRFRIETLAGYFLDQRDGLLPYAPIYIFAFLGIVLLLRRRRSGFWTLALVAMPYVLVSALLTQRTGYAPQARPLVAVIWSLAILLGTFLAENRIKLFSSLAGMAGLITFILTILLLLNPLALYQETTEGASTHGGALFLQLSNLHYSLEKVMPSFLKTDGSWLPNFVVLALLAIFIIAYALWKKQDFRPRRVVIVVLVLFLTGLLSWWLVYFPRDALLNPAKVEFPGGGRLDFSGISLAARMIRPGRFNLIEDNRRFYFSFVSRQPLRELNLDFGSTQGEYAAALALFDHTFFKGRTRREVRSLAYPSPPAYRLGKLYYYRLDIHLLKRTRISTAAHPFLFAVRPVW